MMQSLLTKDSSTWLPRFLLPSILGERGLTCFVSAAGGGLVAVDGSVAGCAAGWVVGCLSGYGPVASLLGLCLFLWLKLLRCV